MQNLVQQLNWIYYTYEHWHKKNLDEADITAYHSKLLDSGNIITVSESSGELLGYCEFWRINYEQFGRIICGEPFSAIHEDVWAGHIAYVGNTFILPEHRRGQVYKMLRDRFFELNQDCTHFVGHARRKKSEPVKVFKRSQILERV